MLASARLTRPRRVSLAVLLWLPSGHHSIGPQRGTGRVIFIGVDLGPAIRLGAVGPEAPGHKVPRRLAGLGSLPRFPGVLLPFLCQAIKDYKQSGVLFLKGHET